MRNLQGTWKCPSNMQAITSHSNIWQGTWKFPCILQRNKHMARYMEISMYLAMKHMARYMEISMYLATKDIMVGYMEISMYLAMKQMARNMEISMYLATKDMVGYMEISIPCHVSLQGTWKFPCTFQLNIR